MTLVLCLKGKNGFVLAGDKRNIYQDSLCRFNDDAKKVDKLNDIVGVVAAGDGENFHPILEELKKNNLSNKDVEEIVNDIKELASQRMANWVCANLSLYQLNKANPPSYCFIVAGYTHNGKQKIYSLNVEDFFPREITNNYYAEGITSIAYKTLSIEYNINLTLEEMKTLAKKMIKETSEISYAVSKKNNIIKIPQLNNKIK